MPGNTNLTLAPDGKRFAVFPIPEAAGPEKGSVHVTFLLNFFDELRRGNRRGENRAPFWNDLPTAQASASSCCGQQGDPRLDSFTGAKSPCSSPSDRQ